MRLLDIETGHESDLRHTLKQFPTRTHTLYCFVPINYSHVGSIMNGEGTVGERNVLQLQAGMRKYD